MVHRDGEVAVPHGRVEDMACRPARGKKSAVADGAMTALRLVSGV